MTRRARMGSAASEFEAASLGDKRLDRRLVKIGERLSAAPEDSFPKLATTEAEREAMYRFFQNDSIAYTDILAPHIHATSERCEHEGLVRIAHDTTSFAFKGEREGLGWVGRKEGFFAHFALAVSQDESRAPLGVLGMQHFLKHHDAGATRREKHKKSREKGRRQKQSYRWVELAEQCEAELEGRCTCIHVMDQEADDYALFADLVQRQCRFVIRGSSGRRTAARPDKVQDKLEGSSSSAFRTVGIGRRIKTRGGHNARREREATLRIRGGRVTLRRPEWSHATNATVELNVVQVFEPDPPDGEEPISWTLYTTEKIDTDKEMVAVVDHYRARWRIEELFKSLKTGCAFEKRQLATLDGLLRALAVFAPIAWRLLALRAMSRMPEQVKAKTLFDDVQLHVIRTLAQGCELPRAPTARQVMLAIARIGGHIQSNGEPGWIVLGRGYADFLKAEVGFRAALALMQRNGGKM